MPTQLARGDQQVLNQEDDDPAHEDHGVGMNQQRSLEAGAAHGELKRKACYDDKRHDDGQRRKDAVGPARRVRSRHDTPPDVSGET